MSFAKLFKQSNSSIYSLPGNVIECSIELTRGNVFYLETGLKSATACFQNELRGSVGGRRTSPLLGSLGFTVSSPTFFTKKINQLSEQGRRAETSKDNKIPQSTINKISQRAIKEKDTIGNNHNYNNYNVAIEDLELFGEPKLVLPKSLQTIRKRKLVWSELSKIWCSSQNRIRGFILNSVKGGYAVAIAGHIAFLPKSLLMSLPVGRLSLRTKSYGQSQFRFFSILNMNESFQNIVVKELPSTIVKKKKAIVAGSRPTAANSSRSDVLSQKMSLKRKVPVKIKK